MVRGLLAAGLAGFIFANGVFPGQHIECGGKEVAGKEFGKLVSI